MNHKLYAYDLISVHFGGGVVGVIALAFFSKDYGVVYNWNKASGIVSMTAFKQKLKHSSEIKYWLDHSPCFSDFQRQLACGIALFVRLT